MWLQLSTFLGNVPICPPNNKRKLRDLQEATTNMSGKLILGQPFSKNAYGLFSKYIHQPKRLVNHPISCSYNSNTFLLTQYILSYFQVNLHFYYPPFYYPLYVLIKCLHFTMHFLLSTLKIFFLKIRKFLNSEKLREKRFESRKISEHLGTEDVKQIFLIEFFNSIRFIYRKKTNHLA